jgi:hypothetical protein
MTTSSAVLKVRLFGTQVGLRTDALAGSGGESVANHSEEKGGGPAERARRAPMRAGISDTPSLSGSSVQVRRHVTPVQWLRVP